MLIDLVLGLKERTRNSSDLNQDGEKVISYDLHGKITIDNENKEIYFKGYLRYKANLDMCIIEGLPQQRHLNSGKISYAPAKDAKTKRDLIISTAKKGSEGKNYEFSYDEKEDEITIKVLENLRKESGAIGRSLGRPTEKIFKI